jgi:hypothetical protein
MGSTPSVQINIPQNFNYFAIQFGLADRLRLVVPSIENINITRKVLALYWPIDGFHESPGFVEFKLDGSPWATLAKTVDINVKYFLCALIKEYYAIGWHLKCSTDLILRGGESSFVIFER